MSSAARDDYSFARPPRREGSFILPRLHSTQIDLIVVLDTSGSVTDEEMQEFVSELDALKGQVRARITLHGCDYALAPNGPWYFEPWEQFALPKNLTGGGGTRFVPAFEWVKQGGLSPDLLLYFTDAQGEFPKQPPPYPVVWLVKGKGQVPWGHRIQLN
jgi:predicted metal-dependent peptidase